MNFVIFSKSSFSLTRTGEVCICWILFFQSWFLRCEFASNSNVAFLPRKFVSMPNLVKKSVIFYKKFGDFCLSHTARADEHNRFCKIDLNCLSENWNSILATAPPGTFLVSRLGILTEVSPKGTDEFESVRGETVGGIEVVDFKALLVWLKPNGSKMYSDTSP